MSPQYEYLCPMCGNRRVVVERMDQLCVCGMIMRRDYCAENVGIIRPLHGHFNNSLGHYVDGKRGFREGLKRQSELATQRTGIEHNFVEVDASDPSSVGVTEEGLDSQARQMVSENKLETKRFL